MLHANAKRQRGKVPMSIKIMPNVGMNIIDIFGPAGWVFESHRTLEIDRFLVTRSPPGWLAYGAGTLKMEPQITLLVQLPAH